MNSCKMNEGEDFRFSPLALLYAAYSDQRPTIGQVVAEGSRVPEQSVLFRTLCQICSETERAAFLEGVRVGARLMMELQ